MQVTTTRRIFSLLVAGRRLPAATLALSAASRRLTTLSAMPPRNQTANNAGVYLIRHMPSGLLYVGQANDVRKRWREHRRELKAGSHHNKGLQELWRSSGENHFEFEIVANPPSGLSALELQRWLAGEEKRIYCDFKERGVALNEAEPEIVHTNDAVKEYIRGQDDRDKKYHAERKAARREIDQKRAELERTLAPQAQHLSALKRQYFEKSELIKNSTGWRRLFHGRPPGFNPEEERKQLGVLASEMNHIWASVHSLQDEISRLGAEYHRLGKESYGLIRALKLKYLVD